MSGLGGFTLHTVAVSVMHGPAAADPCCRARPQRAQRHCCLTVALGRAANTRRHQQLETCCLNPPRRMNLLSENTPPLLSAPAQRQRAFCGLRLHGALREPRPVPPQPPGTAAQTQHPAAGRAAVTSSVQPERVCTSSNWEALQRCENRLHDETQDTVASRQLPRTPPTLCISFRVSCETQGKQPG